MIISRLRNFKVVVIFKVFGISILLMLLLSFAHKKGGKNKNVKYHIELCTKTDYLIVWDSLSTPQIIIQDSEQLLYNRDIILVKKIVFKHFNSTYTLEISEFSDKGIPIKSSLWNLFLHKKDSIYNWLRVSYYDHKGKLTRKDAYECRDTSCTSKGFQLYRYDSLGYLIDKWDSLESIIGHYIYLYDSKGHLLEESYVGSPYTSTIMKSYKHVYKYSEEGIRIRAYKYNEKGDLVNSDTIIVPYKNTEEYKSAVAATIAKWHQQPGQYSKYNKKGALVEKKMINYQGVLNIYQYDKKGNIKIHETYDLQGLNMRTIFVNKNYSITNSYSGDSISNIHIDKSSFDKIGNEVVDSVFENNRLTRIIKREYQYY